MLYTSLNTFIEEIVSIEQTRVETCEAVGDNELNTSPRGSKIRFDPSHFTQTYSRSLKPFPTSLLGS